MPFFTAFPSNAQITITSEMFEGQLWLSVFQDMKWTLDLPATSVEPLIKLLRQAKKGK